MAEIVRPVAVAGPLQDDLGSPGRVWLVKDAESPQPLWLLGEYRFTREEADRFAAFLNGEDALEAENATLRVRLESAEGHAAEVVQEWQAAVSQVEAVKALARRWAQRGLLRDMEGTITGRLARELRGVLGEGGAS